VRIFFGKIGRNGEPVAHLEAGQIEIYPAGKKLPLVNVERALRIGQLPAALRPVYG